MDERLSKLQIKFPDGWRDISAENPDGPPTFAHEELDDQGVLQISTAEYISGEVPNPGYSDLLKLSKNVGLKNEFGALRVEASGDCAYGKYGFAEFSGPDFPYSAVWLLSNGKDFIFATFICTAQPDQKQVSDVKEILMSIRKASFFGNLFK